MKIKMGKNVGRNINKKMTAMFDGCTLRVSFDISIKKVIIKKGVVKLSGAECDK